MIAFDYNKVLKEVIKPIKMALILSVLLPVSLVTGFILGLVTGIYLWSKCVVNYMNGEYDSADNKPDIN